MMRTTLNLPDDVLQIARSAAAARGVSLGDALAGLVRQGIREATRVNTRKAFPCFDVPGNAHPITLERTLEAEDEP